MSTASDHDDELDPGSIIDVAWALVSDGEAREAEHALRELLDDAHLDALDEADARHLLGAVLEEFGDSPGMVREWLLVRELDDDADLRRPHIDTQRFADVAERALAELPAELLVKLGNVAVLIDDRPSAEMVRDGVDPRLLGMFSGVSMPNQSSLGGAPYPLVIQLFQRNLEAAADTEDELVEQIRITVIHETAHFFGLDDDQLGRIGLG